MSDNDTRLDTALAAVRDLGVFQLAGDADCASPDSSTSPGAGFLTRVRDGFLYAVEYAHETDQTLAQTVESMRNDGSLSEIADGAPSIYTHEKWQQFVDLAAHQEDPTELGYDGSDMDQAASVCLYMIAERLVEALAALAVEAWDDADDNDED